MMEAWTKVIVHPLGLVGFALFLVLLLLRKHNSETNQPWIGHVFMLMALIALVGGLGLAYYQSIDKKPLIGGS